MTAGLGHTAEGLSLPGGTDVAPPAPDQPPWRRLMLPAALAGLFVLLAAVCWYFLPLRPDPDEPRVSLAHVQPEEPASDPPPGEWRFAIATMVSARDTFALYRRLAEAVAAALVTPPHAPPASVRMLCRSYADVRNELLRGDVDLALVCTGTYIRAQEEGGVRLLVQPELAPGRRYSSVVLVPGDSPAAVLGDLRNRVMAFTDPESHTGCLVPTAALVDQGFDPRTFFAKVWFAGSHDKATMAVRDRLVDAAAVDTMVWQDMAESDPERMAALRVLWESPSFGPPPIVVPAATPEPRAAALRAAFLSLHESDRGRALLARLGFARFVPPVPADYESARLIHARVRGAGGPFWP